MFMEDVVKDIQCLQRKNSKLQAELVEVKEESHGCTLCTIVIDEKRKRIAALETALREKAVIIADVESRLKTALAEFTNE